MKIISGIYKITNLNNQKSYIGLSDNIERRWKEHRSRPFQPSHHSYNSYFYRAIRSTVKKDSDWDQNWKFEILEECSIENLKEREIYWIAYFDTNNPKKGYNLTEGGDHGYPLKITKDIANQIQDYLKNTNLSQQEIANKFLNVTQRLVSYINLGELWYDPKIQYPIRPYYSQLGIIKEKKYCEKCGKEISKESTLCIQCSGFQKRIVSRPSRDILKRKIRTMPFTLIAMEYGVSDNTIRKWCKAENLPFRAKDIKLYSDKEWEKI